MTVLSRESNRSCVLYGMAARNDWLVLRLSLLVGEGHQREGDPKKPIDLGVR